MTDHTPRRWPLPAVIAAIVLLAVAVGVVLTLASPPGRQTSDARPTPTGSAPAAEPSSAAPASPPSAAGIGDGIYAVGSEIQPGTYAATAGDHPCYWARLRSFGRADSIIDEANLEPGESARVTVKASDRGFKVSNGCTWRPVL